jgi:hypothetical protein
MDYKDYERGFSAGVKAEHDRNVAVLTDYKERFYDDAQDADDPAWDIERAEVVERCLALLRKVRLVSETECNPHESRCCEAHRTHVNPHTGCILR